MMAGPWLRCLTLIIGLAGATASPTAAQTSASEGPPDAPPLSATSVSLPTSTADHSRFEALAGPFKNAEEVNQACLSCHNTGPEQLHGTIHFTWTWPPASAEAPAEGDAGLLGMRHLANGFLLSTPSNLDACTSCHISGTRFDDPAMFDASSEPVAPVDCLSCHEPTGQWSIANFHEGGAACSMCHDERPRGDTPEVKDLAIAARSVGPSTRASCGSCHFNADGGGGVKHGDLNADLIDPAATLDVHMAAAPDGAGFTCSTCHTTRDHAIAGSRYEGAPSAAPDRPALAGAAASCQGCHSATPHKAVASGARLDRHIDRVACETCHIPALARGETSTRILWDWSSIGKLGRDRKPMVDKDKTGQITYSTEKGNLAAANDIRPTLIWSNGQLDPHRPGDALPEPAATEAEADAGDGGMDLDAIERAFANAPWIASYAGDASDAQSRIAPVKVMHSVIPVDAENRHIASVKFSGRSGDALWNRFDWEKAVGAGMEAADLPFSGDVAFAQVRQMIPVNHMVAPAEQALACEACHASDGLLADLPGGFVPRRDGFSMLDWAGLTILAATLAASLIHAMLRVGFGLFYRRRRHD
ncbi:multiheme c-type cytochrome [Tropicimonas sp. IMCC34043]|uniref:multiheme c-type cytochrome n=1 Tax=Tropicimonas sp. IMCC34043 TaxID=2248760 RepID=UPI0018E549F6|nr:multiheme c-type cytochrome [Tropicimonas sp. IMCC34043]